MSSVKIFLFLSFLTTHLLTAQTLVWERMSDTTLGNVQEVKFSPDGDLVVTGYSKGKILFRSIADGEIKREIAHTLASGEDKLLSFALSPDKHYFASGSTYKLNVWDFEADTVKYSFYGYERQNYYDSFYKFNNLEFSNDSKILYYLYYWTSHHYWGDGFGVLGMDSSLRAKLYNHEDWPPSYIPLRRYSSKQDKILLEQFSVLYSSVRYVSIRDTSYDKKEIISFPGQSPVFTPDDEKIIYTQFDAANNKGKIFLSDLQGNTIHTYAGHDGEARIWAATPNGMYFVSTGTTDKKVKMWLIPTGEKVLDFQPHTLDVWKLALSPDGRYLAIAYLDGLVQLYDISSITSVEENSFAKNFFSIRSEGERKFLQVSDGVKYFSAKIFSSGGVEILSLHAQSEENSIEIPTQKLSSGMYFMRCTADGEIFQNLILPVLN